MKATITWVYLKPVEPYIGLYRCSASARRAERVNAPRASAQNAPASRGAAHASRALDARSLRMHRRLVFVAEPKGHVRAVCQSGICVRMHHYTHRRGRTLRQRRPPAAVRRSKPILPRVMVVVRVFSRYAVRCLMEGVRMWFYSRTPRSCIANERKVCQHTKGVGMSMIGCLLLSRKTAV